MLPPSHVVLRRCVYNERQQQSLTSLLVLLMPLPLLLLLLLLFPNSPPRPQDCRSALQLDPRLLDGATLLGHACLRLGLHTDAINFLNEGLSMAISQPGVGGTLYTFCRKGKRAD